MKKNIVKMVLTTALVATAIIGSNKLEAKACYGNSYLPNGACTCGDCYYDETGKEPWDDDYSYMMWCLEKEGSTMSEAEMHASIAENNAKLFGTVAELEDSTTVSHTNLLNMVNTDRAANGAGNLAWNADLEVLAYQRVVEVMANYLSPDYAAVKAAGGNTGEVAHRGMRVGTSENALRVTISGTKTADSSNESWVKSAGHHTNRLNAGYTQYASVSYVDPATNQEVWIEMFK